MNYNEEITLRENGELEKLKREEYDAKELKDLVAKEEEESTSLDPNEKKEEVIGTIIEMTLWGEMHEELKNEKMTPNFEVDKYIIQLNNELKGNIVKKREKNFKKCSWKTMC